MITSVGLTIGGLGIALAIAWANLRTWWRSPGRDPRLLAPFGSGFALGSLSTLCAGGLLGVAAGWTAGITNAVGSRAVPGATGTSNGQIARGDMGELTAGGGLAVFLLTVGVVLMWRSTGKGDDGKKVRRRMVGGAACGVALALTAGMAGILSTTLVPLANAIGDQIIVTIEGAGLL